MTYSVDDIWHILEDVSDPEVPVLTIVDLGIVRKVEVLEDETVQVTITPTYSGCPAMGVIELGIKAALAGKGIRKFSVLTTLSPPWTTDWMSEKGKQKLKDYGIAPPAEESDDSLALFGQPQQIECPKCHSKNTHMVSRFGSTACKSLYQCDDCLEPFDYFKCHR